MASSSNKEPHAAPSPLPQPPKSTAKLSDAAATSAAPEESALAKSSHLTRQELLRRRLRHVRQLSGVYRDYFWALMEECRVQYREYYWKYGISPYKEDEDREAAGEREMVGSVNVEGSGETNTNNNCSFFGSNSNGLAGCGGKLGLGFVEGGAGGPESKLGGHNRCAFVGCKFKAMALTSFCHLHILSDPHQKLYKSCNYVIKRCLLVKAGLLFSAQAGPIVCGKPILRSTVPSLCSVHLQKAQKHVTRALRKAGLNSSSTKLAPKFHVIVAEYVRQIQAKRRASRKPSSSSVAVVKEECVS